MQYVSLTTLKLLSCELYPIIPNTTLNVVRQAGVFKKSEGYPKWEDASIDSDLPIVTKEIKPIFSKVSSEELRMKLEELRLNK